MTSVSRLSMLLSLLQRFELQQKALSGFLSDDCSCPIYSFVINLLKINSNYLRKQLIEFSDYFKVDLTAEFQSNNLLLN